MWRQSGVQSQQIEYLSRRSSRRQTSWVCTSAAEELNQALPETNPAGCLGGSRHFKSGAQTARPRCLHLLNVAFLTFVAFVDYVITMLFQAQEMIRGSGRYLRDQFQTSIDPEMVPVKGRVLPPPQVKLGPQDRALTPRDGGWDMRNQALFDVASIDTWTLASFAPRQRCNEDTLRNFCRQMSSVSNREGIRMPEQPADVSFARGFGDVRSFVCSSERVIGQRIGFVCGYFKFKFYSYCWLGLSWIITSSTGSNFLSV